MCIVCEYQTSSGQVCVLSVSIRQFMDRNVYCLSVSDIFWTGMCIVCQYQTVWTGMCIVCQYQIVSGQVCVLSVSIRPVYVLFVSIRHVCVFPLRIRPFPDMYVHSLSASDRNVYCLSESDSFWTGMCMVCQYQTVLDGFVYCLSELDSLDRYVYFVLVSVRYVYCVSESAWNVYFLSVSDIFWTGMCTSCQYKTVSGKLYVLCVSIRQFLDR